MATMQKVRPVQVDQLERPATEVSPWPNDLDHQGRFFRLREFYTDEQLATVLDCSMKRIETWKGKVSSKDTYHNLSFLNRLDAAVQVTRAFEGIVGREDVSGEMFKVRAQLDGRSFVDMINSPECHLVRGAVERLVVTESGT